MYGIMSGTMSIQMLGDVAMSEEINITNNGFNKGDVFTVETDSPIVGNIMMLVIKMKGPTKEKPFVCSKIEVMIAYKFFEFPCSEPLFVEEGKKSITLSVSGRTAYNIKLSSCSSTVDPVFIEFSGSEGSSTFVSLSDIGFNVGDYNITAYAD